MLKISDRRELMKFVIFPCLDIGCGECYEWGGMLPNGVVGVDINPKVPGTIKHDITQGLPFPDKSFNTTVILEVFEHIDPQKRDFVISEIKRVTVKRVIISVPDKNDKRNFPLDNPNHEHWKHKDWLFSKEEVMELAKKFSNNFTLYEIENPYHYGYGLVCELI
jgi:hypothetical protein